MDDKIHKVTVLSRRKFDEYCRKNNIHDYNVDDLNGKMAFISIIGTEDCRLYYLHDEEEQHYFTKEHPNVLNMEFDDLDEDIEKDGRHYLAINEQQAERIVDFIEHNINSDFFIHCRAGVSRSQGVARFLQDAYDGHFALSSESNPCVLPNKKVVNELITAKFGPMI
jgi:hypothetical protein